MHFSCQRIRDPRLTADSFKDRRVDRRDVIVYRLIGDLTTVNVMHDVAIEAPFNRRGKKPSGQAVLGSTAQSSINRNAFGPKWIVALDGYGLFVSDRLAGFSEKRVIRQNERNTGLMRTSARVAAWETYD